MVAPMSHTPPRMLATMFPTDSLKLFAPAKIFSPAFWVAPRASDAFD